MKPPLQPDSDPRSAGDGDMSLLHAEALGRIFQGVLICDEMRRILYANAAFEKITGYSAAELLGRNSSLLQGAGTDPDTVERLRSTVRAGQSFEGEILNYRKDGTPFWNELSITPVRDDKGRLIRFIGVQRDVTARKGVEEDLRESEERFAGAFEYAPIGVALVSPDGHWLKVNRAVCDLVGYSEKELLARTFQDVTHPDDLAADLEHVRRMLEGKINTYEMEKRYIHARGHIVTVLLNVSLVRDKQGKPAYFISQIQNITDRKRAEEALQASAAEFRSLAEAMPQIVWIASPDGQNIYFNQQWMDYTGLTLEESLGHGWSKPFHPYDEERAQKAWKKSLATGSPYAIECRLRSANDDYRWWLIRGMPQRNAAGQILKWFGTCTDIHDLKLADLEISRTNRALKMLGTCNEALIRAEHEQELLDQICRVAVDIGGYRMAWVGYARDDEMHSIEPIAHAGMENGYLTEINVSWDAGKLNGQGPAGRAILTGRPIVCEEVTQDPQFALWREIALRRGYRSLISLPLRMRGRTFGALLLYTSESHIYAGEEIKLLQELADNLAFGISNIRNRQEARRVEDAVLKIAQGVSSGTGSEFFDLLTTSAVEALNADVGLIGLLREDGASVECMSLMVDRHKVDNVIYSLKGTPCEEVMTDGFCAFERGVQQLFPEDHMLSDLEIESYAGLPLRDSEGNALGLLVVLFRNPIEQSEIIASALRIFASRAASELERRAADAVTREQAALLDKASDAIVVRDLEQRVTYWNKSAEHLYGWTAREAMGRPTTELIYRDGAAFQYALRELLQTGEWSGELQQITRDGQDLVVDSRWTLMRDEADEPKSIFVINTDVTERKKAQEAQLLTAKRMELAAKASKVGIWDWDVVTGKLHWDDQMYLLYGANPKTIPPGTDLWLTCVHPEDKAYAYGASAAALPPGGKPFDISFRIIVPPNNAIRHIRAQAVVIRDAEGQPLRMLGTNWDVTEQVEREEILRQKLDGERALRLQALAGEKAKSEFLAVMSHEIRTPMNGVLGFAEMLLQSPTLSPENRDISQTIVSSGEALLRILDDILDFSRIEARRLAIENRVFSPQELIKDIHTLFMRQIQEKQLEFLVSIDENLPDCLQGDAGRIRQILVNLIGNALKFTEQGSIRVNARISSRAGGDSFVKFVVQDTGPGIAPDRVHAIFEAFQQEDSSISRRHGGTGLGLTISRRLAELMGGALQMNSRLGEGATFTLLLPLVLADIKGNVESKTDVPPSQVDSEFALRHPLRILVVEDDKVNLKLSVSMLRKLGYEPIEARNGVEAVALYEQERPECILMDVQMPEMDGMEAARKIREIENARALQPVFIIALTANISPDDQQQCLTAGMNAYLNKPVKSLAIANLLAGAFQFRQGRSA